jgi:subtilase family serine protease
MRLLRSLSLPLAAFAILCSTAMAQRFAPTVRITNRIDESNLVTLRGNTHPAANAHNDLGRVNDSLPMTDLILVLSRDAAQQAAFEKFVASQYDSTSPNYHQWLTPEQVGANFGPAQSDIATVTNWLTGHGFTVSSVSKDGLSIRFSGNAGLVTNAFHTEIHNLQVKGVNHIGNMSDPQIPAALSSVVVGVKSLHNFFPRPAHHMGAEVSRDSASGRWARPLAASPTATKVSNALTPSALLGATETPAAVNPNFTITVGGAEPYLVEDVAPADFATIYNIAPLWNSGIDGTGQVIAIAGTSDICVGQTTPACETTATSGSYNNDVATFRTFFGLPTSNSWNTPIRISGNSQPLTVCTDTVVTALCSDDDLIENSLDVEWSASVAKNAQIVLVASYPASTSDDNLYDSESYIVNNISTDSHLQGVRIMNVSYGECELGNGTAGNVSYYDLWQQAAAEGIAVFVAAGDSGSASCDDGGDAQYGVPYAAEYGLTVSGLADTPYNTAVGGTDFNWCPVDTAFNATSASTTCQAAPYWTATNNASAGQSSAKGYVPEVPWNDTCANPLTLKFLQDFANQVYGVTSGINTTEQACNFVLDYATGYDGLEQIDPGLLYIVDTVGGSGGASNCVVNTTSSAITNQTIGACTTTATSTGSTTNPDTNATQASINVVNNGWPKPSWQTGVTGIPSDGVRDIPDVSFFASDGYISSSAYLICVSAVSVDPECTYSTNSEPFAEEVGGTSVATPAMAGIMALINQKTGASQGNPNAILYKLAAKQSYSSCSAETVTASGTCMFNDIDTGTNAMPCDAYDKTPNCTATQSFGGYADEIGIATGYSAIQGYDLATGLGSLNVYNVVTAWPATVGASAATVTVKPGQSTLNASNSLSVTVTLASNPTGGSTPTGTVTLSVPTSSGSTYTASATSLTGSYSFTIPGNTLLGSPGGALDTITATYAGDSTYASATNTAQVTVTAATLLNPTVTVSPASTTLNSNSSLSVPVTVTGLGQTPTGTVTLTVGSYNSGAQTLVNGAYTFTIPANTLSSGSDTINVAYSGDANYAASATNPKTVTVTEATFALSQPAIVVTPGTVAPGSSATAVVTVTSVNGYTGTVTLTCNALSTTASGGDGATCAITPGGGNGVNLTSTTTSGTVSFTVSTTASFTVGELSRPTLPGSGGGLLGAGSAVLAFLVFLGIPARQRSWRKMLGVVVLLAAFGGLAACGSGGSGGGGGGGYTDPGTTAGTYTFTVQGTGSPTVNPAVSQTFTVTVN